MTDDHDRKGSPVSTAMTVRRATTVTDAPPETEPLSGDVAATRVGGDIVDEWGKQSFPASDPPANW